MLFHLTRAASQGVRRGPGGAVRAREDLPDTLRYDNHVAAASRDYVILHGRFSGNGLPAAWIVADILRLKDGGSRSAGT